MEIKLKKGVRFLESIESMALSKARDIVYVSGLTRMNSSSKIFVLELHELELIGESFICFANADPKKRCKRDTKLLLVIWSACRRRRGKYFWPPGVPKFSICT